MKKHPTTIRPFLGSLVLIVVFFLACSKDFDHIILDDFGFSFNEEHEKNGLVFNPVTTNFDLIPEKEISTVKYYFKYKVTDGKGYFLKKGDTIKANDTLVLSKQNFVYDYVPCTPGSHKVTVTAWDSHSNIEELELVYESAFADFTFELNKGVNDFIINSKNPLSIALFRDNTSEDFEITYNIKNGTGKLYYSNNALESGKEFYVPKGVNHLDYLPETLGEHLITVNAKAPDGAISTKELTIEVINLEFTLNAIASSTQVELDAELPINIDLKTQDEDSEVSYEITHSFASESTGAGTVRDQNSTVLKAGQYNAITPNSYTYSFSSSDLGQRKLYFDVRDSNGQVKRDSIEIEVTNIPFTFTGSSESNSIYIGSKNHLNFNLKSSGNTENIEYQLFYEITEGDGKVFDLNGNELKNSTDYPIEIGNFELYYVPESIGSHKIEFKVVDNHGQEVGPVIVDFESKQNDFELTMTPAKNSEYANLPVDIIINVNEIPEGTNDSYEAFYSSGRNGSIQLKGKEYGPGEKFILSPDVNYLTYIGTEPGEHNIVLSVESSVNITHTLDAIINYNQVDFSFTGAANNTDIAVGETTSFNFNITETISSSDFTMRYSIYGNGIIKDTNGNELTPGSIYDIPKGNFNWSFEATSPGNINITFYAQNQTGLNKEVNIDLIVDPKDYTFIANPTSSEAFTGDPVTINFNISEIGVGGDTYVMYYSSGSNSGSFVLNGKAYAPGETFEVGVGSFSGTYTGNSEGNHNLIFNTRSSSDVSKSVPVNIEFEKYSEGFDLNISQDWADKYEGQPFQITSVTNASEGHDPDVEYEMTYTFVGATAGYIVYKGKIYTEGELIPLDYGSTPMQFYPQTDENFTINFRVENSTGISKTVSEPVTMFKKPLAKVKGEKHNVSCGGLNGCDYETRIYICWDVDCSESFNGASIQYIEVRIWNRRSNKWDTLLFNYNDASGQGVERRFLLEKEGKERDLRYLDQRYEVRIQDSNGQWSEKATGSIIRV